MLLLITALIFHSKKTVLAGLDVLYRVLDADQVLVVLKELAEGRLGVMPAALMRITATRGESTQYA